MKKGFTLVELLAVIVVLAIIMVIATPSVLSTLEVAKKKSFLTYVQKVFSKGQAQFLADSELEDIPTYDAIEYVYDIEKDLGMDDTGDYKGMYMYIYCADNQTGWCFSDGYDKEDREGVLLYNDEYLFFGFVDGGEPKESDIMPMSSFPEEMKTLLNSVNLKEFYAQNELLNLCGGEKYIVNGGLDATGKKYSVLAHTTFYPENYNLDGSCKTQNPDYFSW
jgi:prepilin-type N-terminal cleavage/methylation domain-containing protein